MRLEDVAGAAGVSIPTASRALRGLPDAAPETTARVVAAAARLGYTGSTVARALRTGRYATLSVLLPFRAVGWWEPVLRGAAAEAEREGYHLLLQPLARERAYAEALDAAATSLPVDGALIVVEAPLEDAIAELSRRRGPVVAVDDVHRAPWWPSICADNELGGYLAGRHLAACGRTRPVVLVPRVGGAFVDARIAGFRRALREAGLELPDDRVLRTDEEFAPVAERSARLEELIAQGTAFDAVFALCDFLAFPAMRTLRAAGRDVPRDVSVVGFDDERGSQLVDPTLTTIRQPFEAIGAAAARELMRQIGGHEARPGRTELPVELVIRGSSLPPGRGGA